jgi:hypothetical protein
MKKNQERKRNVKEKKRKNQTEKEKKHKHTLLPKLLFFFENQYHIYL